MDKLCCAQQIVDHCDSVVKSEAIGVNLDEVLDCVLFVLKDEADAFFLVVGKDNIDNLVSENVLLV